MNGKSRGGRRGWVARTALLYLLLVLAAFAVGTSGLPGRAAAAVASWLSDGGHVELHGPVGQMLLG